MILSLIIHHGKADADLQARARREADYTFSPSLRNAAGNLEG
jgi:hypothetical protein